MSSSQTTIPASAPATSSTRASTTPQQQQQEETQPETQGAEFTNVEVDTMLELAPKYSTRIRHCESMKHVPEKLPSREDVPISSAARVFLLHNLLTPEECQHYIRETESLVYRDLNGEFDADYRSNQRILVLSEKLADHIYSRMQLQLNRSDVLRVRPMCFGNSGTWKPVRLNECFKFGKYQQKQHFGTHIDGPWVPRTDESSIYTVLIYLNDNFTGGRTVFIPEEQRSQMDAKITEMRRTQCEEYDQIVGGGGVGGGGGAVNTSSPPPPPPPSAATAGYTTNANGIVTILPRCGSALLFTHDTLHAGLPVVSGCKYVMRTELMFHRVDSEMIPAAVRNSFETDPAYQRTLKLYRESHEKNKKGDVAGFTNSYLAALKLQHEAQLSIAADTRAIHQLNLPIALYIHTFTYLTTSELANALCVNKSYKDIAQDGTLWKQLYRLRFPTEQTERIVKMKQEYEKTAASVRKKKDEVKEVKQELTIKIISASSSSTPSIPEHQLQRLVTATPGHITIDPAIQDWYTLFKQRIQLERDFQPIIFEFGSEMTRCGFMKSPHSRNRKAASHMTADDEISFLSCVALVPGIHDVHMRRGSSYAALVGEAALAQDGGDDENPMEYLQYIFERGHCVDMSVLPELLSYGYTRMKVWSHRHPILFAEPPFQWSRGFKETLVKRIRHVFRSPGVAFANSALLTLLSDPEFGSSGIVVHIESESVWVSGIYQYRQLVLADFTSSLHSPNQDSNDEYFRRHPEVEHRTDRSYLQERKILKANKQVKSINPLLLASAIVDVYERMNALLQKKDEESTAASSPPINQVLVSGSELPDDFQKQLNLAIEKYNKSKSFTRHPTYIALVQVKEYSNEDSSWIKQDEQAVPSTTPPSADLLLTYSPHPTSDIIHGGKIFSGLPQFQRYTIQTFDLNLTKERYHDWRMYEELWDPTDWLGTQTLFDIIAEHFHYEDAEQAYIANTSASEEECEKLLDPKRYNPYQGHSDKSHTRYLAWRRRIVGSKPRWKKDKPVKKQSTNYYPSFSSSSSSSPTPASIAAAKLLTRQLTHRSAFPILPEVAAKWFESELKLLSTSSTDLYEKQEKTYEAKYTVSLIRPKFGVHHLVYDQKWMESKEEKKGMTKKQRDERKRMTAEKLMENSDVKEMEEPEWYINTKGNLTQAATETSAASNTLQLSSV